MQLRGIEQHVVALNLSGEFSDRCYTLREHLASAREGRLTRRAR